MQSNTNKSDFSILSNDIKYNLLPSLLDDATLANYARTSKTALESVQYELRKRIASQSLPKLIPNEYTSFILHNGNVYGCGINNNGELGFADTEMVQQLKKIENIPGEIKQITSGDGYILALTDQGLFVAGNND